MRTRGIGRVAFWVMASTVAGSGACGDDGDEGDGSVCGRITAALRRCNLISGQPECSSTAEGPSDECVVGCMENAECATLTQALCGAEQAPSEGALELEACADRCWAALGFQCASADQGIDPSFECDGEPDCADGSDEVACATFACGDGTAVVEAFECDGFGDCGNSADEANCEAHTCGDGTTVPASFRCDRENDCRDGSDEIDCEGSLMLQCSAT